MESQAKEEPKETRVQVVFDSDAMAVIEKLKQAKGNRATTADVLRDALGLYEWARVQLAEGYQLGLLRDGTPVKEIVLPFMPKKR